MEPHCHAKLGGGVELKDIPTMFANACCRCHCPFCHPMHAVQANVESVFCQPRKAEWTGRLVNITTSNIKHYITLYMHCTCIVNITTSNIKKQLLLLVAVRGVAPDAVALASALLPDQPYS